jgi:protein translocase SecG subunit
LAPALLWQYILGFTLIALSVVIVVLVLMQSGKEKGLSGTIAGSADTFSAKTAASLPTV